MDLSGQAWQRRRGKAAAVALRRCLDAEPQGPLAPKAWLLAARVYAEALSDKATSDRLLAELVKRFPDSEPGRIAAQRLAISDPS
jgi:TolA-binding protein